MPTQVRTVRQLEFLSDDFDRGASQVQQNFRAPHFLFAFPLTLLTVFLCLTCLQTLGVLSQDGVMRFINIQTCKLLFHMGSHHNAINTVALSPNGRHMAAIMDNGSIDVYSMQSITQERNKVPITVYKAESDILLLFTYFIVRIVCSAASLTGSHSFW